MKINILFISQCNLLENSRSIIFLYIILYNNKIVKSLLNNNRIIKKNNNNNQKLNNYTNSTNFLPQNIY